MDLQERERHGSECPLKNDAQSEGTPEEGTHGSVVPGEEALEVVVPENTAGAPADTGAEEMVDSVVPTPYKYEPISRPDGIRCLVLEGATGGADDPLICSLRHYDLDDEPEFEAISYVWGSSQKTQTIICGGRPLAITKNLHTVLLQTRLPGQQRTLWADAICINQDDHREKGHQVVMMSRVYNEASRVLICLGPDKSGHAEDVARLVSEVSQWILQTIESTDGSQGAFPYADESKWPYTDGRWKTLTSLTDTPWFMRGWVVQEAGLAKDAQILWGDTAMKWIELLRLSLWLYRRTTIYWEFSVFISILHLETYAAKHPTEALVLGYTRQPTLLSTLDCGRFLGLEDRRDRIYAFLGLPVAAGARNGLEVKYNLSYLQVYCEFAIWYINTTQNLELLNYIDHDYDALSAGIPSWVPQWHLRQVGLSMLYPEDELILSASKEAAHTPLAEIQGSSLRVHGLLFDRILRTSQVLDYNTTIEDIAEIWSWLQECITDSVYQAAPQLLFFSHLLRLGRRRTHLGSDLDAAHLAAYMIRLQDGKSLPSHSSFNQFRSALADHHGDATVAHDWVKTCLHDRRLVITARGYYGAVRRFAQEKDLCFILFGARIPCMLRQTNREGHYKVLGDAFLVSARQEEDDCFKIGSGPYSREDWLDWNLEEQNICLC